LENALQDSIFPSPQRDPGARMLVRDELRSVLAGARGQVMLTRMIGAFGQNANWDSELLSDHGKALLAAEGMSAEWPGFRKVAAAKLMQQSGGTEKQQAAKAALLALSRVNLPGRIVAFHQAAKRRLG